MRVWLTWVYMSMILSLLRRLKDLGKLHYFLGMSVVQDFENESIWIGQPACVHGNLLTKYSMQECKPVEPGTKLKIADENDVCMDQQLYQSAIGSLMYLSVGTRSDITYAVSSLARYSANPTKEHWSAVKRVMRYLKGTTKLGIYYSNESSNELIGYSDADWGGETTESLPPAS